MARRNPRSRTVSECIVDPAVITNSFNFGNGAISAELESRRQKWIPIAFVKSARFVIVGGKFTLVKEGAFSSKLSSTCTTGFSPHEARIAFISSKCGGLSVKGGGCGFTLGEGDFVCTRRPPRHWAGRAALGRRLGCWRQQFSFVCFEFLHSVQF